MSKGEDCDNSSSRKKRIRHMTAHACAYDGCDKVYFMKQHLDRHVKTYHNKTIPQERRFSCEFCRDNFTTKQNLEKHTYRKHKRDSNCICPFCSKQFPRFTMLAYHLHHHTGANYLRCKYCEKTFSNQIERSKHHQLKHKTFVCDSCNITFTLQKHLTKHKKIEHAISTEYHCDICKKIFKNRSGIVNHLKLHYNADSVFACPDCPKTYTLKRNLKAHITSAHECKSFNCDYPQCGAKLTTKGTLERHYISKHQPKAFTIMKQSKPRKIRKDAGSMKRSSLIKLSNDAVSLREETDLIIASTCSEKQI